jgi:hypothetical protein
VIQIKIAAPSIHYYAQNMFIVPQRRVLLLFALGSMAAGAARGAAGQAAAARV